MRLLACHALCLRCGFLVLVWWFVHELKTRKRIDALAKILQEIEDCETVKEYIDESSDDDCEIKESTDGDYESKESIDDERKW
jgi:hypothetical protein